MKLKNAKRIAQGRAVNFEERFEELERATESRFTRLEDAIISLKDVLLKLHEDNESLRSKKDESIIEPFMRSGEEFVKYLSEEPEQPKEEVKISMKSQNDEMEKAIKLMRKRFGLSPRIGGKAQSEK